MKINTAELQSAALDWAVARCEGDEPLKDGGIGLEYSTDWLSAGPIIEGNCITVFFEYPHKWAATDGNYRMSGDTPLIAAMRCYVASKLGDEIDVPKELI